jgi:hypothetical protein
MHRGIFASALVGLALMWSEGLASAEQSGTASEAMAMLERAVLALKVNEATALSKFNDKNNAEFHVRDLKIKGDPFGQRAYDGVKGSPEGSFSTFDYEFPRPGTTDPVPKQSFETRIGNQGCGVGYYK